MKISEAIGGAARRLADAGVPAPAFDAELLLRHILGRDRAWIISHRDDDMDEDDIRAFEATVSRRASREPLQYIIGRQEFWGLEFVVTKDVLIPRPETELIIETVLDEIKDKTAPIVIDLCTGSGCIAVSIAKEHRGVRVFATDISPLALEIARKNSRRHGVSGSIRFLEGDLFEPLNELSIKGMADVIASNPPYIPEGDIADLQPEVRDYEPRGALAAGPKGTEIQRRIIEAAPDFLKGGGLLVMEMGMGQAEVLTQMLGRTGAFDGPKVLKDLAEIERVIVAKKR